MIVIQKIKQLIIKSLSEDENVIPNILKILNSERKHNNDLIMDMNLELSRAHIYIEMHKENTKEIKNGFDKAFVINNISEFYNKYKGKVIHFLTVLNNK